MKIILQVVKNFQSQEVPAVVITTPNKKYYFNVPETFQRFMKNNHIKLNPNNTIFLTQLSTSRICGLFGQMLTMFESKAAFDTMIYGPAGTGEFFDKIRFKMGYKLLPFAFFDWQNPKSYLYGFRKLETIMELVAMPSYARFFYEMNDHVDAHFKSDPTKFADEINNPNKYITSDNFFRDEICEVHPIHLEGNIVSYVMIANKIPGKVLKEKLTSLGIKGKMVNEIIEKGQITLPCGSIVYSNQVQEKAFPASVIIVVDCQSEVHIEQLSKHSLIRSLFAESIAKEDLTMATIVHLGKFEIVSMDAYQDLFSRFETTCEHIFTCQELSQSNLTDPEVELINKNFNHFGFVEALHHAFPGHFPPLKQEIDFFEHTKISVEKAFPLLKRATVSKRYFDYIVQPGKSQGHFGYFNQILKDFTQTRVEVRSKLEEFLPSYVRSERNIESFNKCDFSIYNPELVFLGTGSMKPASFRNVSAVYVRNDKTNSGMILDCGEGTYYQLLNQYGESRLETEILPNLHIIFISHIHSDHHLGILNLIRQRHLAIKKSKTLVGSPPRLFLVVPFNMAPWLQIYSELIEDLNCSIVFNQEITEVKSKLHDMVTSSLFGSMSKESLEYYEHPEQNKIITDFFVHRESDLKAFHTFLESSGITSFTAIPVEHCPQSYALVYTHENGIKICYSGDLRPSDEFIRVASDATIFIHEATFNDDLHENAEKNMHCTVKEATTSAMKANAWRLVLTHFSQRYQKVVLPSADDKSILEEDKDYYSFLESNSVLAFDHLSGQVSDFEQLTFKTRLAQDLFPNE